MPTPNNATPLTVEERVALGMAARARLTRAELAGWQPAPDRPDPIGLLEQQAKTRIPELVPIRYGRMLASPFAFYRGASVIMAADLGVMPRTGLQVQFCGDAHLANFGGFASPEREFVLDVNDFDETLPGPWEWDVERLAASIEIVGRDLALGGRVRRSLVLGAAAAYRQAMHEFAAMGNLALWGLHLDPAGLRARWGATVSAKTIKALDADFARAQSRDNVRAYEKLTERVGGRLRIAAHPPLVVPIEDLAPDQRPEQTSALMRSLVDSYASTLQSDRRQLLENYHYVHIARKAVGVGSVGTRCYIMLLLGRDETDPLFLQVKEAEASVLEPYLEHSRYDDHGQRVVEGQRLTQAASDIFLGWARVAAGLDDRPHDFYVRQLWDWKTSTDIEAMTTDEIMVYGKMCGWTIARAHAKSGDRIAIRAYLGEDASFDEAIADFAAAYTDQNQRDYQALVSAVKGGRIKAEKGV